MQILSNFKTNISNVFWSTHAHMITRNGCHHSSGDGVELDTFHVSPAGSVLLSPQVAPCIHLAGLLQSSQLSETGTRGGMETLAFRYPHSKSSSFLPTSFPSLMPFLLTFPSPSTVSPSSHRVMTASFCYKDLSVFPFFQCNHHPG